MSAKHIHRLVKSEQWPKAWFAVNSALNEDPDNPELLYLAGSVLRAQGHIGMALPLLGKALAVEKKQPNLWMHYAATLHDLNQWEDAIQAFKIVASMLPTDAMPPANIAASMTQMARWHDAIQWADKALALDAQNYIAHISKSFACLALGRWEAGWHHQRYLYGHHLVVRVYNDPEHEEPEWDGTKGQTVVVQADQGIGDIIMFSQCLPQLMRDCKEVILECAERLVPLMKRTFPGLTVYGTLKQAGQEWSLNHDIDAHIHISALPRFYRKREDDFPREAYLKPDDGKVQKWKDWLSQFPRPWVGISWQGGIQATQKHRRSLRLSDLGPVIHQDGTYIDLSYKDNSVEIEQWNLVHKNKVQQPAIDQGDYEDTCALLMALDEVVTVTTAIVHACGAMGRSCKVLVPDEPMWRYAHRCADGMIWYPPDTVEMFRKVKGEEWSSTIKRLAKTMPKRLLLAA